MPVTPQHAVVIDDVIIIGRRCVYCTSTLLGRCLCKHVDVYIITLSCTWRIYALSECLLVFSVMNELHTTVLWLFGLHDILPVKFTCLTVFLTISVQVLFSLPLGLAPSTSHSIHFFTQSLSSFCNICPYHRNLFCCSTKIMSSNPSLSLSLYLELNPIA